MAERSFKSEVAKLRLGAGEEFRGEGILAVTKALLQSGVSYVSGYQGAPISHLVDVLADADDVLRDLGIRFEASANEAAAAATLAASINYPLRGAATFKSTVGTNVASDALANLASGGVTGGALIIVGEDYGEGSSIMQERSHAFAMKSQMWLVDPRPNLPSIVQAVEKSFELSEASNTPVMLELRIRACHVYGSFTARDNARPAFTLRDALDHPRAMPIEQYVLVPVNQHNKIFRIIHVYVEDRLGADADPVTARRARPLGVGADPARGRPDEPAPRARLGRQARAARGLPRARRRLDWDARDAAPRRPAVRRRPSRARASTTGSSRAARWNASSPTTRSAPPCARRPRTPARGSAASACAATAQHVSAASWDSVIFDVPGRTSLQRVPTMEPLRGTRAHVEALLDACPTAAELLDRSAR